jgi:two-component system clock-associated histidine kinase SasA
LVFPLLNRNELEINGLIVIQLLLFVDERPGSQETIEKIRSYLDSLDSPLCLNHLQVIEIKEQPHLLEHFRLVATPALIKIAPEPRHTLAGGNLVNQLEKWYPKWIQAIQEQEHPSEEFREELQGIGYSAELLRLSDEIFRLKQENEKLVEQLNFKDQVMAMLAHDLRSPLSAASMAVETLEIAKQNPKGLKDLQIEDQLLQQARNQLRMINRMITDILQTSKNKDSQLSMQWSRLNLQSLCYEIIEQYRESITEKSLLLEYDLPQGLPAVYADSDLIRQVIINLLDNAIKYTPIKGKISLCILHRTNQKMQVTVADNGLGIPQEKQELIFEGHFRLQRDQAKDGYGIGLAVCRKIIRAHYGQIWVDSELGKGSFFHFTLPVYQ